MANKKSGLGKGLGQLFLENSVDELVANNTLPLEEIVPNKEQPRKTFDETALEELAESIRQHGVLQPFWCGPCPVVDTSWWPVSGDTEPAASPDCERFRW